MDDDFEPRRMATVDFENDMEEDSSDAFGNDGDEKTKDKKSSGGVHVKNLKKPLSNISSGELISRRLGKSVDADLLQLLKHELSWSSGIDENSMWRMSKEATKNDQVWL